MNNVNVAKIQLNGNPYEINKGTNLDQLLNKLKIQKFRRNGKCCQSFWCGHSNGRNSKSKYFG